MKLKKIFLKRMKWVKLIKKKILKICLIIILKKIITNYNNINIDKNLKTLNQNIEKNNLNDVLKDDIFLKNEKVITKDVENLESDSNILINKNKIILYQIIK